MDGSFSPQPTEYISFNFDCTGEESNFPYNFSASPLNTNNYLSMDQTYSGTDDADSSGGSFFRWDSPSPPAFDAPQEGSPRMDGISSLQRFRSYDHSDNTFSDARTYSGTDQPLSGSSYEEALYNKDSSFTEPGNEWPVDGSPRMDGTSSPQRSGSYGSYHHSDATFSDGRTYSGTEQSFSGSSAEYAEEEARCNQFLMSMVPDDDSLVDDVFEEGAFPTVLIQGYYPGYGNYHYLHLDRGFYPAQLQAGAEDWDILPLFHEPPSPKGADPNEVVWHRYQESTDCPPYPRGFYSAALSPCSPEVRRLEGPDETPRSQPRARPAIGSSQTYEKLSPERSECYRSYDHSDNTFSDGRTYSGTDQSLSGSSYDDLSVSSGIQKSVTINSPGKSDPLHLNVRVEPLGISQSPSGNHVICDIAVDVEEAVIQPRRIPCLMPPVTDTVRKYDRKHGMFTPRSIFKQGALARRNLFDVSPETPSPRPHLSNQTIEWEHDYLNRVFEIPEADGYQTPSSQEPQDPAWTYPRRKKGIPVSPEQDLISAVEDLGFDYERTPTRSPPWYYPKTN